MFVNLTENQKLLMRRSILFDEVLLALGNESCLFSSLELVKNFVFWFKETLTKSLQIEWVTDYDKNNPTNIKVRKGVHICEEGSKSASGYGAGGPKPLWHRQDGVHGPWITSAVLWILFNTEVKNLFKNMFVCITANTNTHVASKAAKIFSLSPNRRLLQNVHSVMAFEQSTAEPRPWSPGRAKINSAGPLSADLRSQTIFTR